MDILFCIVIESFLFNGYILVVFSHIVVIFGYIVVIFGYIIIIKLLCLD